MTIQRWLQLATALTALLFVFMIAVAWRSAVEERQRAGDIGARTQATMERIEARANALENEAGR
jgi:Mg2+/citrate symporter